MEEIEQFLEDRKTQSLLRTLKPVSYRKNGKIYFSGKEYIDFSSNDYLGLSHHPELLEEAKLAIDAYGIGSCASRLLSGDFKLHHLLEEKTAEFKNKEAALVFNSGYQANIGIISSLYGKGDCIFSDRLNHASLVDGILLSGARFFRFKHNDAEHLKSLLSEHRRNYKKALIITESVFSMDGDTAPLKELLSLKKQYDCRMLVDEAHATGIFGKNGAGLAEQAGLQEEIDLIMGTFSKALAGFGAYLAASKQTIDYLVNTCRSFIYSTSLPPALIVSNLKSLELLKKEPQRRQSLLESAHYLRGLLKGKGFEVIGCSQIVPLMVKDNLKAVVLSKKLQEMGYWVFPIRPPTVPVNQARLRFSLNFNHDKAILKKLVKDLSEIS